MWLWTKPPGRTGGSFKSAPPAAQWSVIIRQQYNGYRSEIGHKKSFIFFLYADSICKILNAGLVTQYFYTVLPGPLLDLCSPSMACELRGFDTARHCHLLVLESFSSCCRRYLHRGSDPPMVVFKCKRTPLKTFLESLITLDSSVFLGIISRCKHVLTFFFFLTLLLCSGQMCPI